MSTQVLWREVWIDSASQGDYLLVLRALENGSLEVIDPQQNWQVVMTFQDYEDAVHWLNEDEYDLVEGRWSAEGGAATDQEPNAVPERASPTDMEQRRLAVSSRAERG